MARGKVYDLAIKIAGTHDPEDPIMHYIYGQRKIVI